MVEHTTVSFRGIITQEVTYKCNYGYQFPDGSLHQSAQCTLSTGRWSFIGNGCSGNLYKIVYTVNL